MLKEISREVVIVHLGRLQMALATRWLRENLQNPGAQEAISRAQGNRDLQGLPIMPLPFLTIMKLDASRHQDVADLARMLGQATEPQLEEAAPPGFPVDSAGSSRLPILPA